MPDYILVIIIHLGEIVSNKKRARPCRLENSEASDLEPCCTWTLGGESSDGGYVGDGDDDDDGDDGDDGDGDGDDGIDYAFEMVINYTNLLSPKKT